MIKVKDNSFLTYKKFSASSLSECLFRVKEIQQLYEYDINLIKQPIMWFRGQSYADFLLEPSLYRKLYDKSSTGMPASADSKFGYMHMSEELRYQNYRSKNIGLSESGISYGRLEWLEHMQHHGMKTRLLDWSESLFHSILFAVEPLLDSKASKDDILKMSPHIWVLFPQMLNAKIFNKLGGETYKKNRFFDGMSERFGKKINSKNIKKMEKNLYNCMENEQGFYNEKIKVGNHLQLLVNLSVIHEEIIRLEQSDMLVNALKKQTYIHPLWPLLNEYYYEGRQVQPFDLAPLVFVQERHSKRIRSQKGVFTIFPFYDEKQLNTHAKMESMPDCRDVMFKIELQNHEKIAQELLSIGVMRDWLYPEDPIVSETIENL